jgi:gliding-associated putative ABC transporter substrate-binding component GldG
MKNIRPYLSLLIIFVVLILLNTLTSSFFVRFDLTQDKRYTLSEATLDLLSQIDEPIVFDVFLDGKYPGSIKRLQIETRQLLEEFRAYNKNVQFVFINPVQDSENPDEIIEAFFEKGMKPINITVEERGKQTQAMVFPWAFAYMGEQSVKVPLLKNMMGATVEEKVNSSVQHLEYAFAQAMSIVSQPKSKTVAVLKGNGQLPDRNMGDFLMQLRETYFIAPFTLDSVSSNPKVTLEKLKEYDLAIMAKPTERFSDEEKQVLDQYIMNGGKMLWLLDHVQIEMDSLYNDQGSTIAMGMDLNLNDLLFKYGIRVNPSLVKDLLATPISLATGQQGSNTQYQQFPWFFSPMIYSESKHPIVANLDAVKFEFANPIDTLANGINKTILLKSSPYSKIIGMPNEVRLSMVTERPEKEEFIGQGSYPVAVLLEGAFTSVYQNRILPFEQKDFTAQGIPNKMVVISDGDVIKNQLDKNLRPLELGFDKWTNSFYANKELLLNTVNYLLDENGLISLRTKEVDLPLLDRERVYENYTKAQLINLGIPLFLIVLLGLGFPYLRKKKYAKH